VCHQQQPTTRASRAEGRNRAGKATQRQAPAFADRFTFPLRQDSNRWTASTGLRLNGSNGTG